MNTNAVDIAKYIVDICTKTGRPISNLKLQKLMYYVQAYSLVKLNRKMFNEEIVAWQYGPVVTEVYNKFCNHAALPIEETYDIPIIMEDRNIIHQVILEKIDIDVWELVDQTHKEDPWNYTTQIYGMGSMIPCEVIKDYFVGKVR